MVVNGLDPEHVYLKWDCNKSQPFSWAAGKDKSRVEGLKNVRLPVKDRKQARYVCHSRSLEVDIRGEIRGRSTVYFAMRAEKLCTVID